MTNNYAQQYKTKKTDVFKCFKELSKILEQMYSNSIKYLISPSFLAVADPTFFAAVAVLDPASLSTVFVAEAPLLSLLYLKHRGDWSD